MSTDTKKFTLTNAWQAVTALGCTAARLINQSNSQIMLALATASGDIVDSELVSSRGAVPFTAIPSGSRVWAKKVGSASATVLVHMGEGSGVVLADGQNVEQIGTTSSKWADDFGGIALNTDNWEVETNVGGMTIGVVNSNMTIGMGTTINAELRLLSKKTFTIPFDLYVAFSMSQRIVNQSVYFEFVEVDPVTGVPIVNANLAGDWANRASILFDGVTTTTARIETVAESAGAMLTQAIASMAATNSAAEYFMEVRPQDIVLTSMIANSATARTAAAGRAATEVPDPNKVYKLRMRFKNGGTAPASNTNVVVNRILTVDCQELAVEVTSGRGDLASNKGIAVNVTNQVGITNGSAQNLVGGVAGSVASTSGGLNSVNRLLSAAATANNTLIKGSASRLYKIKGHNKAAADRFLKFYNKVSAPVAGTDTPAMTFLLPAGQPYEIDFGLMGYYFPTGLGFAITPLAADNDATVCAAGDIVAQNIFFA